MDLDVPGPLDRQLSLRGVQEKRGNGQAKLAVQRVSPAACENARPGAHGRPACHGHHHSALVELCPGRSGLMAKIGARASGTLRQLRIECHAIDRDGLDGASAIDDVAAGWGNETSCAQLVEDDVRREIELVEGLTGEDARAVDRIAYDLMFFKECDAQPALRQSKTCIQPARDHHQ